MSFVSKFLEHTKTYESPGSFWQWSAYTTISAALRDNVWRDLRDIKVYPNIYVLLLAPSGIYRKGLPVDMCKQLLTAISNTKIIAGRSSIQAILDDIGHTETDNKGKIKPKGAAIFIAPELTAGLVSDQAAIGILTDIYDLKTDYTSHLKGTGKKKIDKVVFSMLAASNETLLREVYDVRAMQGGLLARTFLVTPNEFRPGNTLFDKSDNKESFKNLVTLLEEISVLRGEFQFSTDAIKEYEKWYHSFRESYKNKTDKAGVTGRIHMSIFKLSMILSANDLNMEIQQKHMEEAINLGIGLIPNYNHLVVGSGKSDISEAGALFLQEISKADGEVMSRKDFLRKHWSSCDSETLDRVTTTLESAGLIQQVVTGTTMQFALTDKCKEIMKKGGAV